MMYKYVAKNVAIQNGYTVTFMPKPLFQDNGSGMHVHQSLWKDNTNKFFDAKGYGMISQMCKYYIGGLLYHSRPYWPYARRPPTLTAGWCRAMKPPSTWFTLNGTAALQFVFRCIPRVPRASESNTAVRIPAAILISPSLRCC